MPAAVSRARNERGSKPARKFKIKKRSLDMHAKLKKAALSLMALTILICAAGAAFAQEDTAPKKRLHSPATVNGFIGGESHDSYVIKVKKGQKMSVQITWRKESDNRAEFKVSRSDNFFGGESVKFGQSTYLEDKWSGKAPETADYYIYVVGHPTAHYKLKVTVK
jgi:hypothetical protein